MIIISKKAQEILQWYKDTFVDYKTPQEYGRSAFWLWYNQVSNEIRNLKAALVDGNTYKVTIDTGREIITKISIDDITND